MRLIPSAFLPGSDEQPATLPPSPTASHLGIVHVPEKAVGLGVQNKVPPQKLATVLILLDVQKPTNSVLPIHIRHSWALLTSPCMAGGREVPVRRRTLPQDLQEPHSGSTHLCEKLGWHSRRLPSPGHQMFHPNKTLEISIDLIP